MSEQEKETWRANFAPAPHFFELNHACALINDAFDGFGCYLVGSVLTRRDYRDVDVRFIMDDEAYAKLFAHGGVHDPLWSLLCQTISLWLATRTGLPIDFQIQSQTAANARHPGARRQALGIYLRRGSDTEPAASDAKEGAP